VLRSNAAYYPIALRIGKEIVSNHDERAGSASACQQASGTNCLSGTFSVAGRIDQHGCDPGSDSAQSPLFQFLPEPARVRRQEPPIAKFRAGKARGLHLIQNPGVAVHPLVFMSSLDDAPGTGGIGNPDHRLLHSDKAVNCQLR
jgi:hypothetical protein